MAGMKFMMLYLMPLMLLTLVVAAGCVAFGLTL